MPPGALHVLLSCAPLLHTCCGPSFLPLQLTDKEVSRCVSRLEALESRLVSHPLWHSPLLLPGLVSLQHRSSLAAAARAAKRELKAAKVGRERGDGGRLCLVSQLVDWGSGGSQPHSCGGVLVRMMWGHVWRQQPKNAQMHLAKSAVLGKTAGVMLYGLCCMASQSAEPACVWFCLLF